MNVKLQCARYIDLKIGVRDHATYNADRFHN